jgi:hypothetical protein
MKQTINTYESLGAHILKIQPEGFWSEVVTFSIRSDNLYAEGEWEISFSVTSGGMEDNHDPIHQAMALSEAIQFGTDWAKAKYLELTKEK